MTANGQDRRPLVSIVTPAYNAAPYIRETIASVQRQTVRDWEMIIVDDASSDETHALVSEAAAADLRIIPVRLPQNGGPAVSRNTALDRARGEFVAFLDADDLWDPTKLEKQLAFMQARGSEFSFGSYRVISHRGEVVGRVGPVPDTMRYHDLLRNTIIGCLTVVIRREVVGDRRFPLLRRSQDTAMWLSLLRERRMRAHGLNEDLASYRVVPTSNTRNKLVAARSVWTLLRRSEGLSPPVASWYFAHYAVSALSRYIRSRWIAEAERCRGRAV
jgi:teichuronic acid biosynthesis glycosyltransferase TuaG